MSTEAGVEADLSATAWLSVEDGSGLYGGVEHFFEADGLGAELDFVAGIAFGFAAFVFDGEGDVIAKFNDIGLTSESELEGVEAETAGDAETWAGFAAWGVGAFV